ncbi:G5 domain-containing protein [uncultured Anaerococcus sp.]|uniref:G5 domain-containing protein n=1 Tax=uncultured Anaerococcus sp. TaxID=293428 RepID=UPI00263448E3|nr:G5 domain-containing protein [uncultured Anaerococcus sp.]
MNKKQNLLAIALSASFVLAGANVAEANDQVSESVQTEDVKLPITEAENTELDNKKSEGEKTPTAYKSNAEADLPNQNSGAAQVNAENEKKQSATPKTEQNGGEEIGIGEEIQRGAQKSSIESTEPNYSEEEKNIKNYSDSERYKETDLTPGSTIVENVNTDEGKEKDGFKFDTLNPSAGSPDKKAYGYEITIDKKTGQRTYTKINVTDSGRAPIKGGDKPMMGEGEKLTPESPTVTYKPNEDGEATAGRQASYDYEASEETLKHINNKDNESTVIGMKDNYTKDNPEVKFFGDNFAITYKVNPWPNENDKLELLKLNGKYDKKVFVQGQDIDTGIKVDNMDESAKERLVGQVYNPITGAIVPGARAYIGDNGNIHIQMPEGALKKDENGKTVINEKSIFNTPDYKALQNLDVKFFARPRTAEEFKTIAKTPDESGETGTYTETGAGSADINHKGTNVKIDKQGIDRYDHYNLIGNFKLNLDDTKFYDQKFKDQYERPTLDHVFSEVEPGKDFKVKMNDYSSEKDKKERDEFGKTPEDMKKAQAAQQATGTVNLKFFKENNKGKAPEDQWKISIGGEEINLDKVGDKIYKDDLSNIQITAPSSAKAGEFVAVPIEYTYTNGSNDIHWFHFVVKESDNNIPTYDSEAGIADKQLSQKPKLSQTEKDLKKLQPKSYKLAKTEYKDNKGNVWNVSIDEKTGVVTATVPANENIPEDGAKLNVDVEVTYEEEVKVGDKKETRTYTEKTKAQFYSIPSTNQEVKKEYETKLPFETKLIYDDTIPAGKVVEEGGVVGKQKMVFSQIVVGNKKGALDENGKFVEGKEAVSTEIITPAVDKVIKIGTKPAETTVEIPKGLDYELDYSKKDGEPEVVEEGNDGVVTIKTTRNPQTGEITVTKTTTTEAKPKKIKIPAGTEGTHEYTEKKPFTYDIQFDPDFYTNYPDAKDNYKIVTEGKVGEKTTRWTIKNSEIVGEPKIIKDTDPTNAVIKVGQKDYTGVITHKESHEVPFEVEYRYSNELEAGQTKIEQKGEKGSYDIEYSQKIKNGEKDGEATSTKKNEKAAKKEIVVIGTKPVTKVVEKPFNTEYQYDENLEAGKTEEVTPGKNGKVTITTTYNQEQKKVVTSETEEKSQNRVVKIGGKTNGTEKIKEEIPFEVEVRKDPSLKKGEWKYATDDEGNELNGEKGEQEKTLTIVNSKVTETSEPTVTKQAKKAVILVGEGTNDGTHEIVDKKEIPFETRYEYDDSLKPGEEKVVTPGSPGEQERTNTLVIKDGKVVETKEGEFKTTKEPQERLIKIGRKPSEGEITKTIEREIPYETKVIYDENLEAGFQKIENEGKSGKEEVTITQKIKNSKADGEATETTKTITEKEDRVVRIGVKPVEKIVELGNNTEYRQNPELKEGETKVIEEGSKGSVKYITTFNKQTGKLEVTEERTEPKNRVVEYGSKTDGEFTYESEKAYDIIIRENPDLEAGKTNVIQEGKPGKTETTVKIENSKEVSRDTKTITEKQDKIIEVGTKNVCPIPPVTPEKPEENTPKTPGHKDPKDPEKPGEDKPNESGKPGENPEKPQEPGRPKEENPVEKENPKENKVDRTEEIYENPNELSKKTKKPSEADELSKKTKKISEANELSNKKKMANPKTGIGAVAPILTSMGISIAGLLATKKKKKEDQ